MEEETPSGPGRATIAVILLVALMIPVLVAFVLVFPAQAGGSVISSGSTSVSILQGAGNPQSTKWYSPETITVVIGMNNTVNWTNNDNGIPHTVTSDSGSPIPFDSASINAGETFTYTFTTAGTYSYHCTYHPWMRGTVIVKGS